MGLMHLPDPVLVIGTGQPEFTPSARPEKSPIYVKVKGALVGLVVHFAADEDDTDELWEIEIGDMWWPAHALSKELQRQFLDAAIATPWNA
jgi:hypothetical protein